MIKIDLSSVLGDLEKKKQATIQRLRRDGLLDKNKEQKENIVKTSKYKNWSIVRTIIILGVTKEMSRSNILLWAKGALEKQSPINVVDDQFRSPTLAEDLAKGCILIAEKEKKPIKIKIS